MGRAGVKVENPDQVALYHLPHGPASGLAKLAAFQWMRCGPRGC